MAEPRADRAALHAAQAAMAARVLRTDALRPLRRVAGVDVSASRFDPRREVHAAVVLLAWPSLEPLGSASASLPAPLPYIPGLLGLREAPAVLDALARLGATPDLLFVDGQGIAHPRRCGLACQLGVTLDLPAIGVAKSRLVGAAPAPPRLGEAALLRDGGEVVGALLATRARAKPLHVSIGHRLSLETAIALVRAAGRGWRLPEPTRRAHRLAGEVRRAAMARAEAGA